MRRFPPIVAFALLFTAACGGTAELPSDEVSFDQDLAPAIELVSPGIYRGHRPDGTTLRQLKALGVKTILDLEETESAVNSEASAVRALGGMNFINEPMSGFWYPRDAQVNRIEGIMADPSRRPIFVHCLHGEDRTGLIVGLHRVFNEKWSPAAAYKEMIAKGFHRSLFLLNHYYEEKTGFED